MTQYTTSAIPAMTSATIPSGEVISSGYYDADRMAWKAFGGGIGPYLNSWGSTAIMPSWIGYIFPTEFACGAYSLSAPSNNKVTNIDGDGMPRSWNFQGSNDNVTWVTLDTQDNQTAWGNSETRYFELSNAKGEKYKMFRVYVTSNSRPVSKVTYISEIGMYQYEAPPISTGEIGGVLSTPEAGWRRYDDSSPLIKYKGDWTKSTTSTHYNSTASVGSGIDAKLSFFFTGTKIRIICYINTTRSSAVSISIDGVQGVFATDMRSDSSQILVYEKTNLEDKLHRVEIKNTIVGKTFVFDAVDIDAGGELILPSTKCIIKNPITNQHYSLAEKTLIQSPNGSPKTIALHGIASNKEMSLDTSFDNITILLETNKTGEDKLLVHDLGRNPISIKFK